MRGKSADLNREFMDEKDAGDLIKLNQASWELNAEMEDVLDYQALEGGWGEDPGPENNLE